MEKHEFHLVKGDYEISSNGEYIVFTGKTLIIFKIDGAYVASRSDLGKIRKSIFVDIDKLLLDCSSKGVYVLISLKDGSERWRVAQPKLDYTFSRFALSQDKCYAYDRYDLAGKYSYLQINLLTGTTYNYPIKNHLRCISDLVCDRQGNPCFLQYHFEESDDEQKVHISKNGINKSCIVNGNRIPNYQLLFLWDFPYPLVSKFFLGDVDTILTQSLHIYKPSTGQISELIDNRSIWESTAQAPIDYRIDYNRQYLILLCDTVNVVIDINTHKLVGRYVAKYRFGCIVGNEFWLCTDKGIVRKPFPVIEEIPHIKPTLWSPWK